MPKWEYSAFLLPGEPLTTDVLVETFKNLGDALDDAEVVAIIPQRLQLEEGGADEPMRYTVVNAIVVTRHAN